MSFITKRERVFNGYDLYDLPARNEGKLKAYASCTDARAWSHFCSDKTEHLVEIIKRNNDTCRPKYVPTDVIVQTLMVSKNAEIARLKRKIEEFEQMLLAYDQLELTCEQKCEIAKAHAAIKAANKELDEMCLDLDLSGFTEGMESDAFETGKSRGDEPSLYRHEEGLSRESGSVKSRGDEWNFEEDSPKTDTKSNQTGLVCTCDASTNAEDPRIQEMKETIISKDAKLSAMQNTIAVFENDVCEPYCIYADIYTALVKIFVVLCQNDKYKLYLNLMTAGKDTTCIDIKGKILFKLKVLEKFSLALIAPCSQEETNDSSTDCACLRAEVIARIDFPQGSEEIKKPKLDIKRAQLVADIIDSDEMKEILSKKSSLDKNEDDQTDDGLDSYSIDTENLKRLKNLQENYVELVDCYEKVKLERDNLQYGYNKYEELEKEYQILKNQLIEYNALWNEKEHYRKRSSDLDSLKEQYLVLADETSNLETQLRAESDINLIKSNTIEELRVENIALEKKLNEAQITFEKEKNSLECKLKETECKVMCQEEQIKSLSVQIDRLLEQGHEKSFEDSAQSLILIDEVASLNEQIKNLKDSLCCTEEEKQNIHKEFQNKLRIISDLRMEIENWKSSYEAAIQRNEYLEKYTDDCQEELQRLVEENKTLSQDVKEKSEAIENLTKVINTRSHEVDTLLNKIEETDHDRNFIYKQLQNLQESYNHSISKLENEKETALDILHLAKQESQELLHKISNVDNITCIEKINNDEYSKSKQTGQQLYLSAPRSNQSINRLSDKSELLEEIQNLRQVHSYALQNIGNIRDERNEYKESLEATKKESEVITNKLSEAEYALKAMKVAHESAIKEINKLENDLESKNSELKLALQSKELSKKESEDLLKVTNEHFKALENKFNILNIAHNNLLKEKQYLQNELCEKSKELEHKLSSLADRNQDLLQYSREISELEKKLKDLNAAYEEVVTEKKYLQNSLKLKVIEINKLNDELNTQVEENNNLKGKINTLIVNQSLARENIIALENTNSITESTLNSIKKESAVLMDRLKQFETLEREYNKLMVEHDCIKAELNNIKTAVEKLQTENCHLNDESENLRSLNETLEKSLIDARTKHIKSFDGPNIGSYEEVLTNLRDMKEEKLKNHNKINELLMKLDEYENTIANLEEDVMVRNNKIANLENHINELEDEIRKLHSLLDTAIDTEEQMSHNSFEKYEASIKNLEAHHSRATHNIKMELANLQKERTNLERQLSDSKLKSEETFKDKHKYLSQLLHLQNERKAIVNCIKQLETKSVCDSTLSPDHCKIDDILESLNRISRTLDTKKTMEKTILNVQSSSQLLLSKADEAIKIVEKEKQKIIMEKEDAIREKIQMENRFEKLKTTLEDQISRDQETIKDFEAKLLNKNLMDQNYITKLKTELQNLQSLYQNSISEVENLHEKILKLSEENSNYLESNGTLNTTLNQKNDIISMLQKELENINNKSFCDLEVQVTFTNNRNMSVQTENFEKYQEMNNDSELLKKGDTMINSNIFQPTQRVETSNLVPNLLPKENLHSVNEVHILTANVEPSFDFVKNNYLNHKIQSHAPSKLKQYSISNEDCAQNSGNQTHDIVMNNYSPIVNSSSEDSDMSNANNDNSLDCFLKPDSRILGIESSSCTGSYIDKEKNKTINATRRNDDIGSTNSRLLTLNQHSNKDIYMIYTDNDMNHNDNVFSNHSLITTKEHKELSDASKSKRKKTNKPYHQQKKEKINKRNIYLHEEEENDDDSVKPKLNISLPRVQSDNHSTTSDVDQKTLESFILSPKSNSLTNIKILSDLKMKTIKNETPSMISMPIVSNEDYEYLEDSNKLERESIKNLHYKDKFNANNLQNKHPAQHQFDKHSNLDQNLSDEIKLSSRNMKLNHKTDNDNASLDSLSRINDDAYSAKVNNHIGEPIQDLIPHNTENFGLDYILDTVKHKINLDSTNIFSSHPRISRSHEKIQPHLKEQSSNHDPVVLSFEDKNGFSEIHGNSKIIDKSLIDKDTISKVNDLKSYDDKIKYLTKALELTEKDYKIKLQAIKSQYDSNIQNIINGHNQGVKNIQSLHEDTLQDVIKSHENEIENLRTMSIEANRRAERLEKENRSLKMRIQDNLLTELDEEPTKISPDVKKRKKSLIDSKLTKTNVVACNVKPKAKHQGPCTCSLDVNISDTIRNIFEQVDVDQRKMTEHTYIKYIANKISNGNVEALDAQELSFLHLKVCRTWKMKLSKEEALQKRIDNLESEMMSRQRLAQQHIAELDRKVEEEKRRLQEVREKVCRSPMRSRTASPVSGCQFCVLKPTAAEKDIGCRIGSVAMDLLGTRRSAGDLAPGVSTATGLRQKRARMESNRAVSAKLNVEEKREKKLCNDEPPTRLRRSHDRQAIRFQRK